MIKVCLTTIAALLFAASVSAQPRPGAFTTLTTSDTSVTSLCVGANAIPPATCLGGAQMGPAVVNQAVTLPSFTPGVVTNKLYNVGGNLFWNGLALATGGSVGPGTAGFIPVFTGAASIGNSIMSQAGTVITLAGTLTSTGFGTSSFSASGVGLQSVNVANTLAGVANRARFIASSDAVNLEFSAQSSTFTTAGSLVQASGLLQSDGVGGLTVSASNGAGIIRFFSGGAQRGSITSAGLWSWATFGSHSFGAGGTGFQTLSVANPTAGAGNGAGLLVNSDTVLTQLLTQSSTFTTAGIQVQAGSTLFGNGAGGFSIASTHASGALRFYTQGIQRWGINAAGDWTFGTAGNIADSSGTPTIGGFGGAGLINGTDYAFQVAPSGGTTGTVTFGRAAFSPFCVASSSTAGGTITAVQPASGSVTLFYTFTAGMLINVLCRGF